MAANAGEGDFVLRFMSRKIKVEMASFNAVGDPSSA